ncbi:MAG: DUF3987 domain-containing protein [Thermoanaerobaculia bacterium]|nr:DUF3987 domain-containing protein [Myxococcota bacterium]MCK6682673.1 DUF3987 domain-containing protein [Thermoanaerobaculia bacterium]
MALQVPPDLPALLALSVISTAVAKRFEVEVRAGWIEPLNLYALVALASGTRKSVVFEAATAPVVAYEFEHVRRARAAEPMTKEAALRLVVDAPSVDLPRRARTVVVEEPSAWRVFVSDATPERIASLLVENGGRAAVLSDEGEICSIIAGRYGGSFEVFLKAHSGQVMTIERQGRARVHVRRPALTLGLAVQPDVLRSLLAKNAVRERGLLARFLFAMPKSNVGFRTIAPPPVEASVIAEYGAKLRSLLAHEDRFDDDGDLRTTTIRFTKDALASFIAFETEVEAMLRPEGELVAITSWGSKLAGAVARLASILALADAQKATEVGAEHVAAAIEIGRYAIPHALAAMSEAGIDRTLADARSVLQWIAKNELTEVSRREIHQALRTRFPRSTDLAGPLVTLEERGFLRPITGDDRPGRPSERYEVHPRALKGEF